MPIFLSSRLRKFIAWLALCAMCFGAAAPTVSKWLAAQAQTVDLIAICDEHGVTLVATSELQAQAQHQQQGHQHSGKSGGGQSDDRGDCCPYCTLLHHWPCVPAAAVMLAPHAPLFAAHRVAASVLAPPLRVWRRPYAPRGPPLALA